MDDKRKQILVDYISYLYTTGRSYDSIGKYIKYVTDFLENSEEINRRGYYKYKAGESYKVNGEEVKGCLLYTSDAADEL